MSYFKRHTYLDMPAEPQSPSATSGKPTALETWLVKNLLSLMGNPALRFELWDGSAIDGNPARTAQAVVCIRTRRTLWRLISSPGLHFGDDYCAGLIEVDGDLVEMMEAVYGARRPLAEASLLQRYAVNRPTWMRRNSLRGSKKNIHHHYDLGNDFYRLWLDEAMVYTCAYFPDPAMSLEAAQQAKMAHICKKLELQPGEEVVEAGCGWGALGLYMAKHYGVRVTAYNISTEQIRYARERARQENLDHRVTYVADDCRNINGDYDVFVSVGMLEHVGRGNHRKFGAVIDRCLKDDGRGLVHSISQNEPQPVNPWLERRIFPGGYPPTLREMAGMIESFAGVVTDVEDLRIHYARTLEHWLQRFAAHEQEIAQMYDERFVRAWRLYLSASIANFSTNNLQLYQVLFTRPQPRPGHWSRAYMYEGVSEQQK